MDTPVLMEGQGTKKIVSKRNWKKEKLKAERIKSKALPKIPNCRHTKKKNALQCNNITMQDVRRFHQMFYQNKDKASQDSFILKYTEEHKPETARKKTICIKYFIRTKNDGLVQICQNAFRGILGVSKFRLQNISKYHMLTGKSPKERRGGDTRTKKYAAVKEAVRDFIKNLKCVDSHYSRNKSARQYLPSDGNVKKFWRDYNNGAEPELKIAYHYFLNIFKTDFKLSFKSPATDACSECIRLDGIISGAQGTEKVENMAKKTVHKMKAKAFHAMLGKEDPRVYKFSFDCQKNLVLPKVPDQAAYYSRQLYQYNMTLCEGHSKNVQNPDTVQIFTWTEHERKKGSNEISSILYFHLKNKNLEDIDKIQLFADGCPGQNKNITVIGMLAKWLYETPSKIKTIDYIFPIVGHSYLPPDRVFGRIEKILRKKDTIVHPDEYKEIFSKFGTVKHVGVEVPVFDFKDSVAKVIKPPGQLHFKFAMAKRISLKKHKDTILIRGENNYRTDLGSFRPFLKRGKTIQMIDPDMLQNKVEVKREKISDVAKLLIKHFGDKWIENDDLKFYKELLEKNENEFEAEEDEEDDEVEESLDLII